MIRCLVPMPGQAAPGWHEIRPRTLLAIAIASILAVAVAPMQLQAQRRLDQMAACSLASSKPNLRSPEAKPLVRKPAAAAIGCSEVSHG